MYLKAAYTKNGEVFPSVLRSTSALAEKLNTCSFSVYSLDKIEQIQIAWSVLYPNSYA